MRALLLAGGLVVLGVVVVGCSPPPAGCTAASCAGCCDASGSCQGGDTDLACGASALSCQACGAGFGCQSKICVRSSAGGGGGSTGGGGGTTGGGTGGGSVTGGGGGTTGGGGGTTGGGGGTTSCGTMSPPTIPITFPVTCPFPTPCGGNPSPGTFFYTSACIPQEEFNSVVTRIENAGCGAGNVRITGYDGGLAGWATFSNGSNVCRTVRGGVTVSATVTGTCGSPTLCGLLSSGISQGGYTGSCGVDGGACDCLVNRAINIDNAGVAYTVGATTLTVTSSGQTFETCLAGATFSTRESDAGTATHEPGAATLTRQ